MGHEDRSKRGFRRGQQAVDRASYPDLETTNRGRWVRCIAGAMTGAALMAFVVSCAQEDGGLRGTPSPYDLALDLAVDFDVTPDAAPPDGDTDTGDPDAGDAAAVDAAPGDAGD